MTAPQDQGVGFFFEAGVLCERIRSRRRGTPYVHRCREATFRSVIGWIDEHQGESFTLESLGGRRAPPHQRDRARAPRRDHRAGGSAAVIAREHHEAGRLGLRCEGRRCS